MLCLHINEVGFKFYSPIVARQCVEWLVEDINRVIKDREIEETQRSIQYLASQLEQIAIADMRVVFFELIEEQTKNLMIAQVRDEYVFKTIDRAVIPEIKVSPKRSLFVALGMFLGMLLSLLVVGILKFESFLKKPGE